MATLSSTSVTIYGYRTDTYYNKITGHIEWNYTCAKSLNTTEFQYNLSTIKFVVESQSTGQWGSSVTTTVKNQLKYLRVRECQNTFYRPTSGGSVSTTLYTSTSVKTVSLKATGWAEGDTLTLYTANASKTYERSPDGVFSSQLECTLRIGSTSYKNSSSYSTRSKSITTDIPIRTYTKITFSGNHPIYGNDASIERPATRSLTIGSSMGYPGDAVDTTGTGGYRFTGWFSESECLTNISFPYTIPRWAKTLYAGWAAGFQIPYKLNGEWVNCDPFVKVNDVWCPCGEGFVKVNSDWYSLQ